MLIDYATKSRFASWRQVIHGAGWALSVALYHLESKKSLCGWFRRRQRNEKDHPESKKSLCGWFRRRKRNEKDHPESKKACVGGTEAENGRI